MKVSARAFGCLCVATLGVYGFTGSAATPAQSAGIGLFYTNYIVPREPWSIHVVGVSRADHDLEIHSTHARGRALGLATLSEQIKSINPRLGTPVAGINGDFYVRESSYAGDPRGLQVVEGEVISAPVGGVSFWVEPGGLPHAGNVVSKFKVTWPNGATTAFGLNEGRDRGSMVLYTPSVGRSTHTSDGPELELERLGEGLWLPLQLGTTYTARVREVRESGNSPVSSNSLVLSIGPALLRSLPTLEKGMLLKLSTETAPDLQGAKTALSGGPLLVHAGRRQNWLKTSEFNSSSYSARSMTERHPRTAMGWDDKNFYLLEVDGRQKISVGMTLEELADFMIKLGCKEAINLDGGGSAMIWCNGKIVNSPCDRHERVIANALVVVNKRPAQGEGGVPHAQTGSRLPP